MVFSVIVDNIKSFFAKEETLENKPKALPRTASDVYEREDKTKSSNSKKIITNVSKDENQKSEFEQKIVAKELPKSQGLKFSSADLKKKLAQKRGQREQPVSPSLSNNHSIFEQTNQQKQKDIISHDDIKAFEQAISGMPEEVVVTNADSNADSIDDSNSIYLDGYNNRGDINSSDSKKNYLSQSTNTKKTLEGGFFSEYERHLNDKDYKLDPARIDGEALINKMHDYHDQKSQGKDYYIHREELENAIKNKLSDLKEYEYEWFDLKERQESIRRAMQNVEEEIKKRSTELKSLVSQINSEALIMPPKEEIKKEEQKEKEKEENQEKKEEEKEKEKEEETIGDKQEETKRVEQEKKLSQKIQERQEKQVIQEKELINSSTKTQTTNSNAFFLADGKAINNLDELKAALREMPDHVFYQHVSPNRNDFATWIADSLKREEIALEVRKTTNKYEMLNKLNHNWA